MRVFLPMLTGAACAGAMGFAWYTQRSSKMGDTRMSERALRQRLEPFTSIYESMLMSEKEWLALATCCNGERFVDFHRYAGRQPSRPQRSDSMAAVLSTSEVLGSLIIAKLADLIKFTDDFDICKACDPEFIATLIAKSFSKIDGTFDKPNEQRAAYDELKKLYGSDDSLKVNPELLWRLARSCHAVSNTYDKKNPKKKAMLFEGREYATQAYNLDGESFDVLKWLAVLSGSVTDYLGTQEKIEQGYLFKEYLDKAIAMQPTEYTLLHMRGRFAFSVANLSWLERKIANTLYATVPEATLDEALEDFLAVEEIKPGSWVENLFYLVQVLLAKKDKAGAVKYMKIALEITPNDDADRQMLADIKRLLSKYS